MTLQTKAKYKTHFFYFGYVYVIIGVLVALLVSYVTNIIVSPKDFEKVTFFIGAEAVEKAKIIDAVNKDKDPSLLETKILTYSLTDSYFSSYLESAGVIGTDIIIIPEQYATDSFASAHGISLDEDAKRELNKIYDFKYVGFKIGSASVDRGILVYDKETNYSLFSSFITYNTETSNNGKYYMFLNKESCNFNSFYKYNDNNTSNHGIEAIKALISYEK